MPAFIRILTPDGLQPAPYQADSLADAVQYEPDGVYTVTNTYHRTRVLKFDAHLDRLEDSARRQNIPLRLDRAWLRAALRQIIEVSGYGDVRFRITVPQNAPDQMILTLEPFVPPPAEVYENGVHCEIVREGRRTNPAAKTTDWMHNRASIQHAFAPGVYEGLLLSEDESILEGTGSNFYGICGGALYTAGTGVLPGIAQQIVLEIAPQIVPVKREAVHAADLARLDEAFITSASRGIVPVVDIDSTPIGDGKPGAITKALRSAYLNWVSEHLEEL